MNEREQLALEALKASKDYADICPETVERVFAENLGKYKKLKDADKAARAQLHAITGAFLSREELNQARAAFERWRQGEEAALNQLLSAHSSTRERLRGADELYDRLFQFSGHPARVLDLACGLNPIYLGARGVSGVTGIDIHGGCVRLINDCAAACGWDVSARLGDLMGETPADECDLALVMKLLPVLEAQKTGTSARLLTQLRARFLAVTFPTRTLGGRGVGMEKHYSEWFERVCPPEIAIRERFIAADELIYLLEKPPRHQ
nr:ArmA_Rmt [uncultured bacterium]